MTSYTPKRPAQVAPYVEIMGVDLTVQFLLTFGSGKLYLASNLGEGSRLVQLIGMDNARRLGENTHRLTRQVPLAKPWLAKVLAAQGMSKNEIARTLRASVQTVRRWLAT